MVAHPETLHILPQGVDTDGLLFLALLFTVLLIEGEDLSRQEPWNPEAPSRGLSLASSHPCVEGIHIWPIARRDDHHAVSTRSKRCRERSHHISQATSLAPGSNLRSHKDDGMLLGRPILCRIPANAIVSNLPIDPGILFIGFSNCSCLLLLFFIPDQRLLQLDGQVITLLSDKRPRHSLAMLKAHLNLRSLPGDSVTAGAPHARERLP